MSLRAKIKGAVDKAFSAVGDLVVSGTLASKAVSGYNFSSGATTSTAKGVAVKVILETTNRTSDGGFKVSALMKSGTVVSLYDTLTIGTDVYNIIDFSDDGFVVTLNLVKEKS